METRNGKWVNVDYSSRSTDGDGGGGSSISSRMPPPPRSLAPPSSSSTTTTTASAREDGDAYAIQVAVSEPVKQGEGMNAYISYKISTSTTRPQFTKSAFSVIRRYSDFIWLHGHLAAMYPGVVVPPLPEKLLVGRFSPEFIESRRRALQLFLHRCCVHPELQHSEHLTTFLEAADDVLAAFKADPRNAAGKGARGSMLFQWLDDTVHSISSTLITAGGSMSGGLGLASVVGSGNGTPPLEKTSVDLDVEDMMAYIDGLEPIMTGLHKHAHGLTKRAREIADGLFEFGVAYALLGKTEDNPSLQQALREIGDCADRLSLLAAEHAEKEALHLEEPILDYIRLVGAVKAALHKRNDVRAAYGAAVTELDTRTAHASKLLKQLHGGGVGGGAGADEKLQLAEDEVMRAQQRVDDAKLEFDIVTERVMREVDRFKREKVADFKRILLDYVQMQIENSKKVEDEWEAIIPRLAGIRIDGESPLAAVPEVISHSLLNEGYIPSDGPLLPSDDDDGTRSDGNDLSSNLLSLSLGQDETAGYYSGSEEFDLDETPTTGMTRVQVRSTHNPDVSL